MELDKRQWYVRWFFWSLTVWDEFKDHGDSSWRYRNGTNLCHFLRVMLVWCPLVLLLNVAVYGAGVAALTALPIYFWGGTGYAYVVGALAIVVGVIISLNALSRRLKEWERRHPPAPKPEKKKEPPKVAVPAAPTGPGFWQVVWQYIVASKQKVCPIITFNHQTQGDVS